IRTDMRAWRGRFWGSSTAGGLSGRFLGRLDTCRVRARERSLIVRNILRQKLTWAMLRSDGGSGLARRVAPSEALFGVEKDGDGAVVHQFDVHHLLEAAGFAAQAGGAHAVDEVFVQVSSFFRSGGFIE